MLEQVDITCPYCFEPNTLSIDLTAGSQSYTEDCRVCCQPIAIAYSLSANGELENISVDAENR